MSDAALSANGFRDAILSVTEGIRTLTSCRDNEVARELPRLVLSNMALTHAKLARKNDRLSERRRDVIRRADETIAGARRRMATATTDFDRDLTALIGPAAPDVSRKLDGRIAVFDRVCNLASRSGQPLTLDDLTIDRRLILVGATNPDAVLADVRAAGAAATFEVA